MFLHTFFQNLKRDDRERKWFNIRGNVGLDYRRSWFSYQLCSGRAFKFEVQHGEANDGDTGTMLAIGFFFFTAYITFNLPRRFYFRRKCVATWDGGREFYLVDGRRYGFYFYDWSFVWNFHAKVNESSSRDPWWMHQYWHLDQWVLGKWEVVESRGTSEENIKFKLGGTEFVMNEIKWTQRRRFRTFIPFALYHHKWNSVEMKIDKPPMRAGKGENSWDLDDDGSFGVSRQWPYALPGWSIKEMDSACRLAISMYIEDHMKDVRKYGSGSGERGTKRDSIYTYIGKEPASETHAVQANETN